MLRWASNTVTPSSSVISISTISRPPCWIDSNEQSNVWNLEQKYVSERSWYISCERTNALHHTTLHHTTPHTLYTLYTLHHTLYTPYNVRTFWKSSARLLMHSSVLSYPTSLQCSVQCDIHKWCQRTNMLIIGTCICNIFSEQCKMQNPRHTSHYTKTKTKTDEQSQK